MNWNITAVANSLLFLRCRGSWPCTWDERHGRRHLCLLTVFLRQTVKDSFELFVEVHSIATYVFGDCSDGVACIRKFVRDVIHALLYDIFVYRVA